MKEVRLLTPWVPFTGEIRSRNITGRAAGTRGCLTSVRCAACSLGLPSIGKPLKGEFHVFSQSSLTEHKSEVSRRAEEGQFDFGGGLGEG